MRLYRALLLLYPSSFRAEYGRQMLHDFEQRRRNAPGALAAAALWTDVLSDTLLNAARVHGEILRADVRYALRAFARAPGFAATAIVVTALGIGANTAVFSLADRVLIRPLPYADPDRLVKLWEAVPGYSRMEPSAANFRDWRARATSFEEMGAIVNAAVNMVGAGEPRRVAHAAVNADVLTMLGRQPALGRSLRLEDDREGAPGAVLLSHALWQRDFGADPSVIGTAVRLDNEPHVIIGVMPAGFAFPTRETEVWTAIRFDAADFDDRDNNYLQVLAKLKPGVTLERAQAEMRVIAAELEREHPKENARSSVRVVALGDEVTDQAWWLLTALAAAAGCVLLIACTNLASLLLARALERRRELSVRTALGAGRERLVRQLLTETLLLAVAGGIAGVLIAIAGAPLLERLAPPALAVAHATTLDGRVLLFAALLTLGTGLAFGVFPALRLSRDTHLSSLRDGARAGAHAGTTRLRAGLVVAQVVAAVVLLVASGLLIRALLRVQNVDPGFRADGVLAVETPLSTASYARTSRREALYGRILSDVRALPGVVNAAYISHLPMVMRGGIWHVIVDGAPQGDEYRASLRFVTPGFFDALRIPILSGRSIADSDTADGLRVAVVSESFVRQFWPRGDALGGRFTIAFEERTVVGVAGDVRVRGLERVSEPQVYLPHKQMAEGSLLGYIPKEMVVRADTGPASLAPAIRRIVEQADPELPVARVRTLGEIVAADTAPRATQVRILGTFAALSLLLAAVGIHGLLSFSVSQRTREIGVRLALGATERDILRLIAGHGMLLAAIGAGAGLACGYAAARGMSALLFGIRPGDPLTYGAAAAVAIVMALSGSLVPAIRASRVDPTTAMRAE